MSKQNQNMPEMTQEQQDKIDAIIAKNAPDGLKKSEEEKKSISKVKKVIGVVSGKGGVGKSLVTSMLAVMCQKAGLKTAIMDADITGPSIPMMFGVHEKAIGIGENICPVATKTGIKLMSMNLLLEQENQPVIWRGPVIGGAVKQFWTDVIWGDVDVMLVDMPPGTGDVPLTVFQTLPVNGIVVVSSPQELVEMIVSKAVNMADLMKIPVLGMVENMSYFQCPDCGKKHEIFGKSRAEEVAAKYNIPAVSKLPMDPSIPAKGDAGLAEELDTDGLKEIFDAIINA